MWRCPNRRCGRWLAVRRHDTHEFLAEPGAARAGRRFLPRYFTDWDLLAMIEDAQPVWSELLTNAIRHAGH